MSREREAKRSKPIGSAPGPPAHAPRHSGGDGALSLHNRIGNAGLLKALTPSRAHEADPAAEARAQRLAESIAAPTTAAPPSAAPSPLGSGQPLDSTERRTFESRLGAPLDSVRVHTGDAAGRAARAQGAKAYTLGEHIAFAPGRYAPQTGAGHDLLAHELAHVVDQRTTGPRIARQPDDSGAAVADSNPVTARWQELIEETQEASEDADLGLGDYLDADSADLPAALAQLQRRLAILTLYEPQTEDELTDLEVAADQFARIDEDPHYIAEHAGEKEQAALEGIAALTAAIKKRDPNRVIHDPLSVAYGFPATWSAKVKKAIRSPWTMSNLVADHEQAKKDMDTAGQAVANELVAHGLPVDFDTAMDLTSFNLFTSDLVAATPTLSAFLQASRAYQRTYAKIQMAQRYERGMQTLVADIASGERIIDVTIFPEYEHRRGWQPSEADITTASFPTNPQATSNMVNPYAYERQTINAILLTTFFDNMTTGKVVRDAYAQRQSEADGKIAGMDGFERMFLSARWASERGYGSYVRGVLWEQLKEAAPGMLKDAVVEGAKFTAIQFVPILNWLYDAYQVGKALVGAAEALYDLHEAEQAVRSATSIVTLQRATARHVLAQHKDVLQLAGSVLEAVGSWKAMRAAMKVRVADAAGAAGEKAAAHLPEKAPKAPSARAGRRALAEGEASAVAEIEKAGIRKSFDAAPGHQIKVTKSGLIVRCTECAFHTIDDLMAEYEDILKHFNHDKLDDWIATVRDLHVTDPDKAARMMADMEAGLARARGLDLPVAGEPGDWAPTNRTELEIRARRGTQIHGILAAERRAAGTWDLVDTPMTDAAGANIRLPEHVNMQTGVPRPGTVLKECKPDAVSFAREIILDDKPLGTNILSEHRGQIFRYIEAYRLRTGKLPKSIVIAFYNPETLAPAMQQAFNPRVFVPLNYPY